MIHAKRIERRALQGEARQAIGMGRKASRSVATRRVKDDEPPLQGQERKTAIEEVIGGLGTAISLLSRAR
jgi:hypothetical protein